MPKSPEHHQVVIVAQDCQSMLVFWLLLSLRAEKQQLAESFESNDDAICSYINTCMQHFEFKIVNQNRNSVGSNNVRKFEAKNREFDYQYMNTFKFARCSKKMMFGSVQ